MLKRNICITLLLFLILVYVKVAHSAVLIFDYVAHIDGSDIPGAPTGSLLTGQFSYDPDKIRRQVGASHYYPELGSASISAHGSNGFHLALDARVIVVTAGDLNDTMTIQSFESESANDWHIVIDFIETGGADGWLIGNNDLPSKYPVPLSDPFMSIYFTDDFEWVKVIDATLLSVTPSSLVPIPSAIWLFGAGLIGLIGVARRKKQ
jgi:hypothetical protein